MITLTVFIPLAAGLIVLFIPSGRSGLIKSVALAGSLFSLAGSLVLLVGLSATPGGPGSSSLSFEERADWIASLGASYHMGVDGLSAPLIALSALLTVVSLVFSWSHRERVKEYFFLFLLLDTGLLGVFAAQDLLLFYLFFEVALVPMYFIIGVWGGERRIYAALKFFLYTRVGSLAMLLSFLALYLSTSPRTFDLPAIVKAQPFAGNFVGGSFVLLGLFLGFAIKLPSFPFHSWLPDAHVEAPTAGSVMLAGALLKLGGYGFIRVALPVVPEAFNSYAVPIIILALISIIYGAAVALVQTDFKKLVAFSSINHMGYVLLGIGIAGVAQASPANRLTALNGAALQMVSHGLLTGGLFLLVGILYDRTHTRQIAAYHGLWQSMPVYSVLAALVFFGSLGLPTLSGFVAEFQVLLGTLGVYPWAAALALVGLIITTAMFLWTLQRMFLGKPTVAGERTSPTVPEPGQATTIILPGKDGKNKTVKAALTPRLLPEINRRELAALVPLVALALLIGIFPGPLVSVINDALKVLPFRVLAGG